MLATKVFKVCVPFDHERQGAVDVARSHVIRWCDAITEGDFVIEHPAVKTLWRGTAFPHALTFRVVISWPPEGLEDKLGTVILSPYTGQEMRTPVLPEDLLGGKENDIFS